MFNSNGCRRFVFASLASLSTAFVSSIASAGPVSLYMVIDPVTTAGAGVPAAGGFNVTSTRAGVGTWHLFAVDEATGSFGIAQIKAQLVGVVPAINNRLTQTLYDTADDSGFKTGLTLLRSGPGTNPITASSELPGTQPYTQGGLGITAGNYSTVPGATGFSGTTNGQWGNYSPTLGQQTSGQTINGNANRNALFVGEGTYTGAPPTISLANSFVAYWTNAAFTTSAQSTAFSAGNPLQDTNPFIFPEPAAISLIGLAMVGLGSLTGRRRS